jgi:hypothetical protein
LATGWSVLCDHLDVAAHVASVAHRPRVAGGCALPHVLAGRGCRPWCGVARCIPEGPDEAVPGEGTPLAGREGERRPSREVPAGGQPPHSGQRERGPARANDRVRLKRQLRRGRLKIDEGSSARPSRRPGSSCSVCYLPCRGWGRSRPPVCSSGWVLAAASPSPASHSASARPRTRTPLGLAVAARRRRC